MKWTIIIDFRFASCFMIIISEDWICSVKQVFSDSFEDLVIVKVVAKFLDIPKLMKRTRTFDTTKQPQNNM